MEKILDIVIVTYNSEDVTLPCLDSVIKSDSSDAFNIVVVDNNSQDATPRILKNAQKRMPNRITSRFEKTNLGFARACNIGAGLFNSKFILFLNPDTLIEDKTALIQMVNFMRADEKVAVAGPRILNDSRGIEHTCRRFPSLSRVFLDECRTYKLFPSKKSFRGTRITDWDHNDTREVAQVIGACLMTRRTIFYELGGFDERFFMYYEEVDYCYRAKQKGYKVYFFSPAEIIHKGGYSSMQESETGTLDIYRYRYESLVAFYKKHFKSYVFFLYVILIPSLLVKFFIEYFLYAVTRNRDYAIISFSYLKAWKYVFFSFFHTKNPEITRSRKKTMKILFLTQTGILGPASRYRVFQFLDYLRNRGVDCTVSPAISDCFYPFFYEKKCGFLKKLLKAFIIITKRIGNLFCLRKFDAVFIQKEILPGCHPFFEFFITRFAKKTVFDFDDSIFLSAKDRIKAAQFSDVNNSPRFTKLFARFSSLTVGNRYLFNIAHKFNKNTTLIPTSINTECYKGSICSSSKVSERINIGWIGSFSTLPYLKIVEKPLISVSKQFKLIFVVVGPAKGHRALQNIFSKTFFDNVNLDYVIWNGEKEAEQLASFDIGIAPLPDIPWSRGKCGCKLLQYMALGIPSIVSPVGIHKDIIVQSKNGLFAGTEKEWIDGLSLLIKNPGIRHSFRNNAVETVEDSYSLRENAVLLEKVLKNL